MLCRTTYSHSFYKYFEVSELSGALSESQPAHLFYWGTSVMTCTDHCLPALEQGFQEQVLWS